MTDSPLDDAPLDGLASAFNPPAHIQADEELAALHAEIVTRMRREAMGIPLETNQLLLLSFIADGYVEIKYRDTHGWGGGDRAMSIARDFRAQWLSQLAEWNKVLKDNKEKISEKLIQDFIDVTVKGASKIKDDNNRREVLLFYKEEFAAAGY